MYLSNATEPDLNNVYYTRCRPCKVGELMVPSSDCIGIYLQAEKYKKKKKKKKKFRQVFEKKIWRFVALFS